jgi:hypothetical protein
VVSTEYCLIQVLDCPVPSCNNVAPVTNLCLGRATTRSQSSQWSKKKVQLKHKNSLFTPFPASLFGCRYHIWRFRRECLHQRVVRNTICRKAPPSVVSGYGKRSINLNKFVATFEKHITPKSPNMVSTSK